MTSRASRIAFAAILVLAVAWALGAIVTVSMALADDGPPPTDDSGTLIVVAVFAGVAFAVALGYLLRSERLRRR
jgi:hypothetical protein